MNNGLSNATSGQLIMPIISFESNGYVALDGVEMQQNVGDFANVLKGLQNLVINKSQPDMLPTEKPVVVHAEQQCTVDFDSDDLVVDSFGSNQVLEEIIEISEAIEPDVFDVEKREASGDQVSDELLIPFRKEVSDVTIRMLMAAYSLPVRASESTQVFDADFMEEAVAPSTAPASDQTSAVRDEPAVEVKSSPVVAKPVVMETASEKA
ncbi:MAG: hypothetical protein PHU01_06690, partial [Desulfuromonadaceae bacterium]|nr:hypothetical protein [Desulfuromonadaceae bacterium]